MKKIRACIAIAVLATLGAAAPGYAWGGGHGSAGGHFGGGHFAHHPRFHGHRHARVFVGVAPFVTVPFWWGYPAYTYVPPPVIVEEPPVYIEKQPAGPSDWYYCPTSRNYYPNVQTCPEPWVRVPATTP